MAKPTEVKFSLARKSSEQNNPPAAWNQLDQDDLFSRSLLSIDDTVLNSIDLNVDSEVKEIKHTTLSPVSETNIRSNRKYENNENHESPRINDIYCSFGDEENNLSFDHQNLSILEKSHIHKMNKGRAELEDICNKTELSLCSKHQRSKTTSDSGIENMDVGDESIFNHIFSRMEFSKPEEQMQNNQLPNANARRDSKVSSTRSVAGKRKLSPIRGSVSRKRNRLSLDLSIPSKTTNADAFYGLPAEAKHLIQEVKGIDKLYEWQDECLNMKAVRERKNLIYALPTSGGKTLVAEILMLREVVCNKKNAIFILPYVAIVQEKVRSLAPFALNLNFLVEEYAAGKGSYPPRKRRRKNTIYVCTIEKGLGLINSLIEMDRLREVGTLVVDELHLLGETGGRGATLEGLLAKLMYSRSNIHIIGMSATIGNLKEIADFLNADLYTKDFRPVDLKEYVKCENEIWLVDLKDEKILTDCKKINYSYSAEAMKIDPDKLGGLVMDVVPQDSCLIFCPSRKNCENVAMLLTRVLFRSLQDYKKPEKKILLRALQSEGTVCEILKKTITFGVAYHHSGLMTEERKLLEEAFRSGTLCVICCTSTLAAGVNLPARRVILRQPYVGNQFLNLSRYKQMIGRAGRAGMNSIGESILICKPNEIPKVTALLTSKMDDCISTIHTEREKGINNLVLSAVLLDLALTRSDLHKLVSMTLLGVQQQKLEVNAKKETDSTISMLMKAGVIKVKEILSDPSTKPNVTVVIPSQESPSNAKFSSPILSNGKRTIKLSKSTKLEVCKLGRAAMKGCIGLDRAHLLYRDLKTAQGQLVLLDSLHLLFLVTPYDIIDSVKPSATVYFDVVCGLSKIQMETARVIGINEAVLHKIRTGIVPKNVETRTINRFYFTLMLNELWNQQSVHVVSTKYQVHRGIVQNLMNSSAAFASCVERFCAELDEFWAFRDLLHSFGKRLSHCCAPELEPLIELPAVRIVRARQLFDAGYKTLQNVASANPNDMSKSVENLPLRNAIQIVAAAKLLLLEKVENLRDEAEEVLDGIDPSTF